MKAIRMLLAFSFILLIGSGFLDVGRVVANPALQDIPRPLEDPQVLPPEIKIISPTNNTNNASSTITLIFTVNAPKSLNTTNTCIWWVYYRTDWLNNMKSPFEPLDEYQCVYYKQDNDTERLNYKEFNATLERVPDGNHTIEVYTAGAITYYEGQYGFGYSDSSIASVNLIVDSSLLQTKNDFCLSLSLMMAGIMILAVVSALLVYFKKHKSKLT
jgi:hypothetical protein